MIRSSSCQRFQAASTVDEESAGSGKPEKASLLQRPSVGGPVRGTLPGRVRLPSTAALCKLLAAMVASLVVFHTASCGFFFCYRFPASMELQFPSAHSAYDDISDVYRLTGGPHVISAARSLATNGGPSGGGDPDEAPKLIPKIIHQTYKSAKVPPPVRPFMHSWRRFNEGWEIRFYDDEACIEFVSREFPEYMAAYRQLPKDVERSDFFRYMVILRLGGVYADVDTECQQPMDSLIRPRDTLVVCWENEFESPAEAEHRHYVRSRQVLQWVFAAAPGHPALREICDHIARHALTRFSNNTNRDTLERTGPGIWTDVILKHATLHPPSKADDPWNVRVLPKIYWGVHPAGLDGMAASEPRVGVLHHFLGSWKAKGGWKKRKLSFGRLLAKITGIFRSHHFTRADVPEDLMRESGMSLYPVSVEWEPPFTMLTTLVGAGDRQAGSDVAAVITAWGTWQPALSPNRRPSVSDALVGSLGGSKAEDQVLLDIGAGLGLFTLAAAARGHRAIAVEASPLSADPLQASIAFNGFEKLVQLHRVAAGALDGETICVERGGKHISDSARGYSTPEVHEAAAGGDCSRTIQRRATAQLVPADVDVAAVRISTNGWESAVLEGLEELLARRPPGVVLVEMQPRLMASHGGGSPEALLTHMHGLGYTDISHSGAVCDERWLNITKSIRLRGAMGLAAQEALKQPTWCRLQPEQFSLLASRAHATAPENVLFTSKTRAAAAALAGPAQAAEKAAGGAASREQSAARDASSGAAAELRLVVGPARAEHGVLRQVSAAGGGSEEAAMAAVHSAAAPSSGLGGGAREEVGSDAAAVSSSARRR